MQIGLLQMSDLRTVPPSKHFEDPPDSARGLSSTQDNQIMVRIPTSTEISYRVLQFLGDSLVIARAPLDLAKTRNLRVDDCLGT